MEASNVRRPTQSATCWRLSKEERLRFDAPGKKTKHKTKPVARIGRAELATRRSRLNIDIKHVPQKQRASTRFAPQFQELDLAPAV